MKVFIGHPGAFGDIIVCAPIAQEYAERGYEVYWPVGVEHLSLVEKFPYVTPIPLPNIKLVSHELENEAVYSSRILMGQDLARQMGAEYLHLGDRFVDGRSMFPTPNMDGETTEEKKYRMAGVDFSRKYRLEWGRDKEKENRLYELVVDSDNYVFCHLNQSDGNRGKLLEEESRSIVECVPIEGYSILDWYKVIINAKAIYCIESSLQAFVDGIQAHTTSERYILPISAGKHTTNHKMSSLYWKKKYI